LPTICRLALSNQLGSVLRRIQQGAHRPPHRPPPQSRACHLYASKGWEPPLSPHCCHSFSKIKVMQVDPDELEISSLSGCEFDRFHYTCEIRLCCVAQNKAHIKPDDYNYDKSCTSDIICATRIVDCLWYHLRRSLLDIQIFSLFLTRPIPLLDKYLLLNWMNPSSDTDTCNPKPKWLHIQVHNDHNLMVQIQEVGRVRIHSTHFVQRADPSGRPSRYSSEWMYSIPVRGGQSRKQGKNGEIQEPSGRILMRHRSGHNPHANMHIETLWDLSSKALLLLPLLCRLWGFQWASAHPWERQTRSVKPQSQRWMSSEGTKEG
jgi:hypothetical protein